MFGRVLVRVCMNTYFFTRQLARNLKEKIELYIAENTTYADGERNRETRCSAASVKCTGNVMKLKRLRIKSFFFTIINSQGVTRLEKKNPENLYIFFLTFIWKIYNL